MDNSQSKETNELLTKGVLLGLLLQPLAQTYLGAKYTGSNFLYYMSLVYFGIIIWGLLFRIGPAKKGQMYTNKGEGGHLVYHDDGLQGHFVGPFPVGLLYMVGLFVPLLFAKEWRGIPLIIVGAATAGYSLLVARKGEFSSLWCYYAIIYAVVALFV